MRWPGLLLIQIALTAGDWTQFRGPNVQVNGGNFGVITDQLNSPREVQLALKLYF